MVPFIDIHTHQLNDKSNVCFVLSTNAEEQLTNGKSVFYSLGIHPWNINSTDIASAIPELEISVSNSAVLAVGEIGLDRTIDTLLTTQLEVFEEQLRIAQKYNKPVIIHCVKCFSEIISCRKKKQYKLPWIIHDFRKNNQIAKDLVALKCYLSFGKTLFSDEKLQSVFKNLPVNRIFLETDDSDIEIEELYKKAAFLKDLKVEDLKEKLFSNFKTCFNRL